MDIEEAILAVLKDPKAVSNFVTAVARLFDNMVAMHGVFRGTHEAVLAEAQGAEIFDSAGQVYTHIESLRQSRQALANRTDEIQRGLTFFARFSSNLSTKTREILQPLLTESSRMQSIMAETERKAAELAQTSGTRLQGVRVGAGGLGAEVARNEASLVTTQLEAQAVQLRARGIEPTLLPNAQMATDYMRRMRSLAINERDSVVKLAPVLTAMRIAISRALAQASAAGRALLSSVLEPLLAALEAIATRFGGMLTTPILIPTELLKSLGLGGPTA